MRPFVFVGSLGPDEKQALEAGLRAGDAFTLRRCQILLASAKGFPPPQIAAIIGCSETNARKIIHAFRSEGLACLHERAPCPKEITAGVNKSKWDDLRALLHQSPRQFGRHRSTWTLSTIAEVCADHGISRRRLSVEGIRLTLKRMGINWKRVRLWITSPDPDYAAKKARRDRLIRLATKHPEWVLGFEDETWWSRLAQPSRHTWVDGPPMKVQVPKRDTRDVDQEAICCYGMLRNDTRKVMLRFVEGRPLGEVTIQFLDWLCWSIGREGKEKLIVVWDEASWHTSDTTLDWVRQHNRLAKRESMPKLTICDLPTGSPWLNNIEPCWTHARKAIMEPDRKLTTQEITNRVCEYFGCQMLPCLKQPT
jgi:transposase